MKIKQKNAGHSLLLLILLLHKVSGSRLPKYVDQQLNNQLSEGIKDEILPLQNVNCSYSFPINCFYMKKRPKPGNWLFAEFQVSSQDSALNHRYKLLAYSKIPQVYGEGEILFESISKKPDPILLDLIVDISSIRQRLIYNSDHLYFILTCIDCGNRVVEGKARNSIGFIIMKSEITSERVKRSLALENDCSNDGELERCCVNKRLASKSMIFENATSIVGPTSIPVTYCVGSCYMNMYKGNHNFALLKYYNSVFGNSQRNLRKALPCCNAKQFRDMAILYVINEDIEIRYSKNFIVMSCSCE